MGWLYRLLENQFYLDAVNQKVFVRGAKRVGRILWQSGDVRLIDGWVVNGSARIVGLFARFMQRLQTGYLYHYAFVMIFSLLCLLLYFVSFRFDR